MEAPKPELVAVAAALDQDALLEALIREEEKAAQKAKEAAEALAPGLSVAELAALTFEEIAEERGEDEEDEEEEEEGGVVLDPSRLLVLTPDAGKIRFAEDIVGDFRGGSGRNRKSRRAAGGAGRGNRRGGVR
jgi:hypothetical protein